MSEKTNYVPRVNQIDAIHLNKEITRLVRENLLENLQAISPTLFIKFQPEIDLLVQSAIWFGSVGRQFSTFGQQLLVLAYDSEKLTISRLCLHFVLTVLPSYIKNVDQHRSNASVVQLLHQAVNWCENGVMVLSVINFFRFLKTGCKPTLIDFCLGLDYISLRYNQRRDIGYKYLTRELLWGGFMEILGLLLPIINFRKVKRLLKSFIIGKMQRSDANETLKLEPAVLASNTNCVYCEERPTLPHHMGCGHIYCYYCLAANVKTDSKFSCVVCEKSCEDNIQIVQYD